MNSIIMEKEESVRDNDENRDQKDEDNDIITSPSLVISSESSPSESTQNDFDKTNQNQEKCSNEEGVAAKVRASLGAKRVRFSICEYITETLVQESCNGAHTNPSFENDNNMGKGSPTNSLTDSSDGGSKIRYIRGKQRRDSVHPLVSPDFQVDPWDVTAIEENSEPTGVPWSELSTKGKIFRVLIGIGKLIGLMALLYFFVCSLDLLSIGFRLIGGSAAGEIFRKSSVLQNPVVGVMIGILTTVLVQSSSTSTSIIVGMVAAGFMDVRLAIPPIMGANIGTSITNTIVSFTQAGDRNQFRRAFAGATVLDMFNWLTVIVLLPIEVLFGYLYYVSKATVDLIIPDSQSDTNIQILSVITNPFVDLFVQLNDTVLECWASPNCTDADDASLIKEYCKTAKTEIIVHERVVDLSGNEILNIRDVAIQQDLQKCNFLFAGTSMSDAAVGAIILVSSLLVLCFCLVMIVKLLNSVLKGHVSTVIKRTLNADIPYVPWITGYLAILIGAVMTFLVQSSSVFTSALTPLVGMGVISLNRVYPLTLGANIGTTTTALLASITAEGKSLYPSLQIALCHFFFNITGVILFYPVPILRIPITLARALGDTTAKYRWFAIFYLVAMFAVLPILFIALSLAGSIYVVVLVSVIGVLLLLIAIITIMQRKVPKMLPGKLRDWSWLPTPMRSLKPYDNLVSKLPCCSRKSLNDDDSDDEDAGFRKPSVYKDSDFVFLSGNKIPPPYDLNRDEENFQRNPRPSITRIVPTRIIRNISNGNGNSDHNNMNGNGITVNKPLSLVNSESRNQLSPEVVIINSQDTESAKANGAKNVSNSSNRNNPHLSNNTIPLPRTYNNGQESPIPNANLNDNISSHYNEFLRSGNLSLNPAYNESSESVLV